MARGQDREVGWGMTRNDEIRRMLETLLERRSMAVGPFMQDRAREDAAMRLAYDCDELLGSIVPTLLEENEEQARRIEELTERLATTTSVGMLFVQKSDEKIAEQARRIERLETERDEARAELRSLTPWGAYSWREAAISVRLKLRENAAQIVALFAERDKALRRIERLERALRDVQDCDEDVVCSVAEAALRGDS